MLLSLLGALAGAAIGTLAALLIGSLYARVARVSSFEGKAGYLVVWGFGPIGLVAGLIAGGAWAFGAHRGAGVGVVARDVALSAITLAGAAAGALFLYSRRSGGPLVTNEPPPQLHFRIRVPAGDGWKVELHTPHNAAEAILRDSDAGVLAGFVELYFRTSKRILVLRAPDGTDRLFTVRLPASPLGARHKAWSPWRRVDFVARPGEPPRRAESSETCEIAVRVSRPGDPPDA